MFPWTDCCVPAIIHRFPPGRGSRIRDENLCFPRTTSSARCQRQYSGRSLFFLVFVRESYSPQSSARRPLARHQLGGVKEQQFQFLPLGVIYVSTHHTRDDAPPFSSPSSIYVIVSHQTSRKKVNGGLTTSAVTQRGPLATGCVQTGDCPD